MMSQTELSVRTIIAIADNIQIIENELKMLATSKVAVEEIAQNLEKGLRSNKLKEEGKAFDVQMLNPAIDAAVEVMHKSIDDIYSHMREQRYFDIINLYKDGIEESNIK